MQPIDAFTQICTGDRFNGSHKTMAHNVMVCLLPSGSEPPRGCRIYAGAAEIGTYWKKQRRWA